MLSICMLVQALSGELLASSIFFIMNACMGRLQILPGFALTNPFRIFLKSLYRDMRAIQRFLITYSLMARP